MSIVNKIVDIINDNIISLASCLSVRAVNLCEVLIKEGKTFPVLIEKGDINSVFFDDSFQCELFHIENNESTITENDRGFGSNKLIIKTFDNSMILYCRNEKTEYINEIIDKSFSTLITSQQRTDLGLYFVEIFTRNINTNKQQVFSNTFGDMRYKVNANDVLIQIDYTITYSLQNICLTPHRNC
jgi:hypothetical protein